MSIYAGTTLAGGNDGTLKVTDEPSPIPGQVIARYVDNKWDTRCIPVQFSMNNTLDPIPSPLGEDFMSLAEATSGVRQALTAWRNIPTLFIDMRLTGTTSNPGLVGFDMVNEVSFRIGYLPPPPFVAGASARSQTTLAKDTYLAAGTDIDEDGDADVAANLTTCQDADGDGDVEFPEGSYQAGTLIDQDVEFNTTDASGFRFTVNTSELGTNARTIDLIGTAMHEFGHAHGLGHSMINQVNPTRGNGTGPTMGTPFDALDGVDQLSLRTLEADDKAWSSYFYPEGSSDTGPAALQRGDIAFNKAYGLLEGELRHGELQQPIAGGSIFAVRARTGEIVSSAMTGTVQLSADPATGITYYFNDPALAILDGKYRLPVPMGTYKIGVEAIDGWPLSKDSFNFTSVVGTRVPGLLTFPEEFFDADESDLEVKPASAKEIPVLAGQTVAGINITTNRTIEINNFGNLEAGGFGGLDQLAGYPVASPGTLYAVGIPAEQIGTVMSGRKLLVQAATFFTSSRDDSVVPVFAEALLTTGVVDPGGTASIDLDKPLRRVTHFIGQDKDFSPFNFREPADLGERVRMGIAAGKIKNLFLVLRIPSKTPFPGPRGLPPTIGMDGFVEGIFQDSDGVAPLGFSFVSDDNGQSFVPVSKYLANRGFTGDFDFMFGLILSEPKSQ